MADGLLKFIRYWLPLMAYISVIFILSSFSKLPVDRSLGLPDKVLHFVEYALLATLTARALRSLAWPVRFWLVLAVVVLAVGLLGLLDEWYQSTVPGREADFYDWMADVLGGLVGGTSYLLVKRMWVARIA